MITTMHILTFGFMVCSLLSGAYYSNFDTARLSSKLAVYMGLVGFCGGVLVFYGVINKGHAAGDMSLRWGSGIFMSGIGCVTSVLSLDII